MDKYHFDIKINETDNNAGNKATRDCKAILLNNGFKDLEISFIKAGFLLPLNLIKLVLVLSYYSIIIHSKSLIIVQYPLKGINTFFRYFIKFLKLKGCKFCCIIHDIDSLRSAYIKNKIKREITTLSSYDAVISHNNAMSSWLKENGFKGFITEICLFDYLVDAGNKRDSTGVSKNTEIVFAGNLGRGDFLKKISFRQFPFILNLYGPGLNKEISTRNDNIKWHGSFSPEQIVDELQGDFGLIWDGESVEEITGLMGNYQKYNTPHKTSLYLASGLPVIISKSAAIAKLVESNNIGICINSLAEISDKVAEINSELYEEMKNNVLLIGVKLRQGYYLEKALVRIEKVLVNNIQHN